MDAVVLLSSAWMRTACVLSALFWVAFRAYQVLSQPVEKLVHVLGLEVPVAPLVSLAGIKADGLLLHWKPPDQRASVLKYVIRINGIDIADISPQETSITIENLQPVHHYTVRIVTLNSSNFQAPSVPIRLRTLPAHADRYSTTDHTKHATPTTPDDGFTPTPIIRPNKSLADVATPFAAPIMTREHSGSFSRARRPESGRRNSPGVLPTDQAGACQGSSDGIDTLGQLTQKVSNLRRELDEIEKEILDEDQDFMTQKSVLLDKRDEKKSALKEKEDASRDLRKEVASLERQNAAAQARRAQQEKILRLKEAEREKLKEDLAKWAREADELCDAAERITQTRLEYESLSEQRIQAAKEKHAVEVYTNKGLEEAVRERGHHIKLLEAEREELEAGQDALDHLEGTDSAERDEDNRWKMTYGLLQAHYAQAWANYLEANRAQEEATARLLFLQQRRISQPQLFSGPSVPELGSARKNGQRTRPLSMRENLFSATSGASVFTSSTSFNNVPATASPSFAAPTPYFNPVNGMALPPRTHSFAVANLESESLTGGAPMSPTAGDLLPSGLFGDDHGLTDAEKEDDLGYPPGHDPLTSLGNVLPGLGAPGTIDRNQDPSSPASPPSHSPAAFASPRDSAGDLQSYPNYDLNMDSDKRSIRSTSSSFMMNPPTSRFGSLFGLNRARGKTFSQEGPSLGSLKPSQSQSLPRQEHDLKSVGGSRRRGSHSEGAWYDSFIRNKAQAPQSPHSPKHVATRKRPFNMFGTKGDLWVSSVLGSDTPDSPRQSSANIGDGMGLPRPSTESQARFGWSVDSFGARSSPLGVDWSVNNTNTASWSRLNSRRPSAQHGSTTNLKNEELMHDDLLDFPSSMQSPTQAPIGTRPMSSHVPAQYPISSLRPVPSTPPKQLNPAAAAFNMFQLGKKTEEGREERAKRAAEKAAGKEAKKAEKAEKKEEKEKRAKAEKAEKAEKVARKEKDKHLAADPFDFRDDESRISRDTPSISTADFSEASPRESLERSISYSASENAGSLGKESFMQKLTRKGSTSQFLTFKKSALLAKNKANDVPSTPDEMNEDDGYLGLGRSVDSLGNSPNIGTLKDKNSLLSWGSIKRMGKKDKTPSLHESIASETTGDEDGFAD